jgi:hypothetical protein
MKLTNNSLNLIPFFTNDENEENEENEDKDNDFQENRKLNKIIEHLYQDLLQANSFLESLKQTKKKKKIGIELYEITVKKITNVYHIPKPKNFNTNSFPEKIRKHIDETCLTEICYTFSLFDRKITLYFITEELDSKINLNVYNKYVDTIILWLYLLNEYASKKCSTYFTVYFYFTSLTKTLPNSTVEILNEHHVNTAFTTTCPSDSEIIVYRKEEWLKVFIHETFHNFALDFSDMNTSRCNKRILELFPVDSEVNLYESYTEFWAEIMNCCLCSFYLIKAKEKDKYHELGSASESGFFLFKKYFVYFIDLERKYSCFQMVKALDFMGLEYKHLYKNDSKSELLRNTMYKEKTNVLSYYVIKTILLFNYPLFLQWCSQHNLSLLQFKKTDSNLMKFCDFIWKYHKTKPMMEMVKEMELYLNELTRGLSRTTKNKNKKKYVLENMRMTICELG